MSIIQCDEDCIYQKDGYCQLELPSAITNYTGDGCVHFIRVVPKDQYEAARFIRATDAPTTQPAPQTPPAPY